MSLRTKLTILSFTLMSLMTIPTLADEAASATSRIENESYNVQIKAPEGWSETKDFNQAIPESFQLYGRTFRGIQFKSSADFQGCAVFFAENDSEMDDEEDDDEDILEDKLAQAQELAFPGSNSFEISEFRVDGIVGADLLSETAKIELKGTVEGTFSTDSGESSKITINGALKADSTKGSFAIGTGQFISEGSMPCAGTIGMQFGDDYQILLVMWGPKENSQLQDTYRFLEGITVTDKDPVETVEEVVAISEPVVVEPVTIPVVVEETATTEPVAVSTPVQPVVVEEAAKPAPETTQPSA